MPISVLVVDDSALIRSLLKEIIQADPELRLVGCAPDAFVARDLIKQHAPDVISLDVEMPRMDGLTFLDKLMKARPTPVLMISSLTERGSEATLRALELGAVDFIAKPRLGIAEGMQAYAEEIRAKLKTVARARLRRRAADAPAPPESAAPLLSTERSSPSAPPPAAPRRSKCCSACRRTVPGGHHPAHASRLHPQLRRAPGSPDPAQRQRSARRRPHTARPRPGRAGRPPHGGAALRRQLRGAFEPPGAGQRPPPGSGRDVRVAGSLRRRNLLAGLLTGMGKDGARGLLAIRQAGGYPWPRTRLPAWSTACPAKRWNWAPRKTCCRSNGSPPRCSSKPPGAAAATASERDPGRPAALFAAPATSPPRPADDRPEPRAFACSPSL